MELQEELELSTKGSIKEKIFISWGGGITTSELISVFDGFGNRIRTTTISDGNYGTVSSSVSATTTWTTTNVDLNYTSTWRVVSVR